MKRILLFCIPTLSLLSFYVLKKSTDDNNIPSSVGQWATFGSVKTGDSVIYWGSKWKQGVILEVGQPYDASAKNAATGELKYKVAEGGGLNWPDWKDFSQVVSPRRETWWTTFFTGQWNLGEVMAINTRREGNYERNEIGYHKATELLIVQPNGSYRWQTGDGKTISGKWIPLEEGPGIILQKAYKGMNWTFINQTNAITLHIRKMENARLFPDGSEMSKAATRPMK